MLKIIYGEKMGFEMAVAMDWCTQNEYSFPFSE